MSSKAESAFYTPLLANPAGAGDPPVLPNYVLVRYNLPPRPSFRAFLRRCLSLSSSLLAFSLFLFFLWPSDPEVQVVRVQLKDIALRTSSSLSLDLSLFVVARVRNRDFFSLDYDSLGVSIGYRGRKLGFVSAKGAHLKARASSYVNATLVIDGFQVLHDFFYFVEDVVRGSVPFDTETTVKGELGFFSIFMIPLKDKVSCEVNVNPLNQTIIHQNCYPEDVIGWWSSRPNDITRIFSKLTLYSIFQQATLRTRPVKYVLARLYANVP